MDHTLYLDARRPELGDAAIETAAAILRRGGLVAFPTETVYGLGADAFDAEAIARTFRAKGRPSDNPLIVHLAEVAQIERCAVVNDCARRAAELLMPGPLTIVLRSRPEVPSIARAGLPTVALRIPEHPVALALIRAAGPLVAPSANRSGRPSPTTAQHVLDDLSGRIDAVLDGGSSQIGIESTVVDMTGERPRLLRPGGITAEELSAALGTEIDGLDAGDRDAPRSPGMKHRHYAPEVPIRLVVAREPPRLDDDLRRVVLTTTQHAASFASHPVRNLSSNTLYAELRQAEADDVDEIVIYVQPGEIPEGLMDRVRRASGEEGRAGSREAGTPGSREAGR